MSLKILDKDLGWVKLETDGEKRSLKLRENDAKRRTKEANNLKRGKIPIPRKKAASGEV